MNRKSLELASSWITNCKIVDTIWEESSFETVKLFDFLQNNFKEKAYKKILQLFDFYKKKKKN